MPVTIDKQYAARRLAAQRTAIKEAPLNNIKVKILKPCKAYVGNDQANLIEFKPGDTPALPKDQAQHFINEYWAELPRAKVAAPRRKPAKAKAKGVPPENK